MPFSEGDFHRVIAPSPANGIRGDTVQARFWNQFIDAFKRTDSSSEVDAKITTALVDVVREHANVTDAPFGAIGDGVADDTAAIQAAVDFVGAAGGGQVFFPPGTYRLTTTTTANGFIWALLIGWDNISLVGAGKASRLFLDVATQAAMFAIGGCVKRAVGLGDDNNWIHHSPFVGNSPAPGWNLTGVIAKGAYAVTLATAADDSNFAIGDYVAIRTGQTISATATGQPDAEINRVKAKPGGGVIELEWATVKPYAQEYYLAGATGVTSATLRGSTVAIAGSSVANPSVITTTTPHGMVGTRRVEIAGHAGSTPAINGIHTATATGPFTFTVPVNVTVAGTGGTVWLVSGAAVLGSSVANPGVITTVEAHGFTTGDRVEIAGHSGSTPDLNGVHTVTVLTTTTFSVPVNVTVAGTGGNVAKRASFQLCNVNDRMLRNVDIRDLAIESRANRHAIIGNSFDQMTIERVYGLFRGGRSFLSTGCFRGQRMRDCVLEHKNLDGYVYAFSPDAGSSDSSYEDNVIITDAGTIHGHVHEGPARIAIRRNTFAHPLNANTNEALVDIRGRAYDVLVEDNEFINGSSSTSAVTVFIDQHSGGGGRVRGNRYLGTHNAYVTNSSGSEAWVIDETVPPKVMTATGNVTASERLILANPSGGNIMASLVTSVSRYAGFAPITFKNVGAANNVVVNPLGAETIDGATSKTLGPRAWITIMKSGNEFIVLSQGGTVT